MADTPIYSDAPPGYAPVASSPTANNTAYSDAPAGYAPVATPPQDTYGATDALVHGATFGLSEPVKALGAAAGDWAAGRGFDYSTAINNENTARAQYESAHPGWNLGLNFLGGVFGAPQKLAAKGAQAVANAAAPSVVKGIATNAGLGAGIGAVSGAADNANSVSDAVTGAGYGALTGGLAGGALGTVGSLIRPNLQPGAQDLINAGVNLTPGQALGGGVRRAENAVSSFPFIGSAIDSGKAGTIEDFNRGAINQALAPIGETLQAGGAGREAIAEMQDKIGKAYDDASSGLGIQPQSPASQQLGNSLTTISQNVKSLPPTQQQQFMTVVNDRLISRLSPGGGISPNDFQDAKSFFGQQGSKYIHSADPDQRDLGQAYFEVQGALKSGLRTSNPGAADALDRADQAYAMAQRVQGAAVKAPGADPGVFSPQGLQASIRQQDPTAGKRAFAAGDALMQPYAEAGRTVIGNVAPSSGSHGVRAGLGGVGLGLLGANELGELLGQFGLPLHYGIGPALGAYGAAKMAYSPLGRRVISGLLSRPPAATPIANGLLSLTPGAAVAAPQAFGGLLSGLPSPQTKY